MRYIACCSCGKDSLAMVLKLIEQNKPLTEVDWNTIWCVCEDDIYSEISEFVVVDNIRKIGG